MRINELRIIRRKFEKGFTLIEILVVIGIATILLSMGLAIGIDTYKSYTRRSERDVVVSVLEKARSRAVNNIYQSPHGVCLDDAAHIYTIFRGNAYIAGADSNEATPSNTAVTISGMPLCSSDSIVFTQLTGTTTNASIVVTQDGKTSTIDINTAGRINW